MKKPAGMIEVDSVTALVAQASALLNQMMTQFSKSRFGVKFMGSVVTLQACVEQI